MTAQLPLDLDLPSAPVDDDRAALLALIAGDPLHQADRERIVDAILYVAARSFGVVDTNRVRERLTYPDTDRLVVMPRLIGSVYHVLLTAGVLVHDGWITNTDRAGGNYGKPQRRYRLIRGA